LRDDQGEIVRNSDLAVDLVRLRTSALSRPDLIVMVQHRRFAYSEHSTVVEIVDRAFDSPLIRLHRQGALAISVITRSARTLGPSDFQDGT
jgi:hypothetical protein